MPQKAAKRQPGPYREPYGIWWSSTANRSTPPDKYELSFLADGRVAGIGECNRFFGPYQVVNANGGIKIGPVASTMMACLDPNIETEFFRMFENVHLYQLDEKNLYLFVDNKIKAVFEPTDKPVDEE